MSIITILVSVLIIILVWGPIAYTVFYKRNEFEKEIPLVIMVLNYFNAFTPLGILFGAYLDNRKKKNNNIKEFKYSDKVRMNGRIILIIAIISTILDFIILK